MLKIISINIISLFGNPVKPVDAHLRKMDKLLKANDVEAIKAKQEAKEVKEEPKTEAEDVPVKMEEEEAKEEVKKEEEEDKKRKREDNEEEKKFDREVTEEEMKGGGDGDAPPAKKKPKTDRCPHCRQDMMGDGIV